MYGSRHSRRLDWTGMALAGLAALAFLGAGCSRHGAFFSNQASATRRPIIEPDAWEDPT